ncbi:hypothetical protein U8695_07415 [Aquirufa antheringensis]
MKTIITTLLVLFLYQTSYAQYDANSVSTSSVSLQNELYSTIKMSRKGDHVKVKYFAAKEYNGTSVYERLNSWKRGKKIIAISSGTYMTECDPDIAIPVGICIDNGKVVNNNLDEKLDGLAIVYATGGMVASNLKNGDLTVSSGNGKRTLDVRNSFQRQEFIKWAQENSATVFQTHLFYYGNKLTIGSNSSPNKRERRFLAVGKDDSGDVKHYLVNLSGANTLYNATLKVSKYLQEYEDVENLIFLINLDTGCQDVFQTYKPTGAVDARKGFSGKAPITQATNLIVYYYE